MSELLKIEMLYGFKCLRPEWSARFRPGAYLEYTGEPPIFMRAPTRPKCDYCGHHLHADGYKCKSCGAPK